MAEQPQPQHPSAFSAFTSQRDDPAALRTRAVAHGPGAGTPRAADLEPGQAELTTRRGCIGPELVAAAVLTISLGIAAG